MTNTTTRPTSFAILGAGLRRQIGGVTAVDIEHLEIRRGVVTGLIGPNGAGKSTLFNVLTGFDRADTGTWSINGEDVSNRRAHLIARAGVVRTFQSTRPLLEMTVLQNMLVPPSGQIGEKLGLALFRWLWRRQDRDLIAKAHGLLREFKLDRLADEMASVLSGGQRRLLEIARALMAEPSVLLLDEPLAGVNPVLRDFIIERLADLRDRGMTIVIIEHDMLSIARVSDWVICMDRGKLIVEGEPNMVLQDERVIDAYLGRSVEAGPRPTAYSSPSPEPGTQTARDAVLEVIDLTAGYSPDLDILRGLSLRLDAGEMVSLIGPNGAGKSTLLKATFGLLPVRKGKILLQGSNIRGLAANELVRRGVGFVPQSANVFGRLSVHENLRMGLYLARRRWNERLAFVEDLFPALQGRGAQMADTLSGGERQSLAMARALMMSPDVLLLDEPSAGLSPQRQEELFRSIKQIQESGVAIMMVEQNARRALEICDRAYVLAEGTNAHTGTGRELLEDPRVAELYLGSSITE
jgi:ABC-type branched-chain amino acid transport systems, ATPase component